MSSSDAKFTAKGIMSVKKQVKKTTTTSQTSYWWGYTTQVNINGGLAANNVLL
jgi:hypothetical protein